jgi:opacity protein-like surface antigen
VHKTKKGDLNQGGAYYNKTDVGLTLGAGVNYALSQKMWLNLDARYGLGLTDVMKGQAQM